MRTKHYDKPSLEVMEVAMEAVLCASAEDDFDFTALGSEGIEDSGYTIKWGK